MSYQNNQNYPNQNDSGYRGRRFRDDGNASYGSDISNFDVSEEPTYPRPQRPQNYENYQNARSNPRRGYYGYQDGYDDRRNGYQQGYDSRRQQRNYDDSYDRYDEYDRRYDRRQYDNRNYRDYDSRPVKPKKRTGGGIIAVRVIAIILLFVGAGIAGYKLYEYYTDQKGHNELQALSHDFDQLYAKNNDFFGWLKIDDTVVDYPVMHTPGDPEKYLHKDFDGNYSESGELFMDANCDPNGYHYLIYGHHMFNGTMFGSLPKYENQDYFNAHRTLRFDTRFEKGEYEIFAVFYSKIYDENEDVFKYYTCANLNNESDYAYYVNGVKSLSIYDTGITPTYGEKIVTLSTCNYHTDDGRFVIAARKVQ
ncbi:sortase domain-bontaining protein [Ruminococcus sp.]|uniref:class B sortase n=1 Tax=Ruminococcus sp. TaxID=41978 RepID=UPI00388F232B